MTKKKPDDAEEPAAPEPAEPTPEERIADLHDKWLRAKAEAGNIRRRAAVEHEEARRHGARDVLLRLLPVLDHLQLALASPPEGTDPSFLEGLRFIEQQWIAALADLGVEPVPGVGAPFDPQHHSAMVEQESAEAEPGTILAEMTRGYTHQGRLLREARVVVAKEPEGDSPPPTDEGS